MKNLMTLLTIFIFIFISNDCKAQVCGIPKIPMAREENKPLIDKIIEITGYENYFKNYCINFIKKTAKKEKWTEEKSESIEAKIDFTKFKTQKLYSLLAYFSTEELNEFIEIYKKNKTNNKNNTIMDNENITEHLESYTQMLIQN